MINKRFREFVCAKLKKYMLCSVCVNFRVVSAVVSPKYSTETTKVTGMPAQGSVADRRGKAATYYESEGTSKNSSE